MLTSVPPLPRRRPRSFPSDDADLFCAGQFVPAGTYREVEGAGRTVVLRQDDYLPASLDGRVACYERIGPAAEPVADAPT